MPSTISELRPQGDIFLQAVQAITSGGMQLGELINVATPLSQSGRINEAKQLYKIWIGLNRNNPHAHLAQFNCACLLSDSGEILEAAQMLSEVVAKDPTFIPAYINLGGLFERAGRIDDGLAQWKKAVLQLAPVNGQAIEYKISALKQLGRVLSDHQQAGQAESTLHECLRMNPDQRDVLGQFLGLRMNQVKWPVVEPWEGVDRKRLLRQAQPLTITAYTDDPYLQLGISAGYVEATIDEAAVDPSLDRRDAPIDLTDRRLRVGYVSSDLRDHAIGYLMSEFFELHDKSKVEVFAYSCGKAGETELTNRIKAAVEHWVDIRDMSDDEAARRIGDDGIDILVDVNGHTRDCRTAVFARRPAPIQVNWLGYPGTMGSPYHHYIVADEWIIPEGSEKYYSEKVVRLPCYQPNDRRRVVAERPTREACGLPQDAFVFCCFNGVHKITRFTFARWMEILHRTPNSVLWLLDSTPEAVASIRAHAQQAGIGPERLIFAQKMANPYHLARYPLADLFLDTTPYGAHTTASDALWMAVPMLTMSGRSFTSRVCGSLMRAAGLPEMIVETPEEYVERAIALAQNPDLLTAFRARLEAGRMECDLFNMDKLTASMEDLYLQMVSDYQRDGLAPQPELINMAAYADVGMAFDHDAQEMQVLADYDGYYATGLANRDRMRPLLPDSRAWQAAEEEPAEMAPEGETETKPRRGAKDRRAKAA